MKVDCDKCGVKILPATYNKNKGLCMPCKGGYRDSIDAVGQFYDEGEADDEGQVMPYVKLTEQVLDLDRSAIHSNIKLIDECLVSLEKASARLNPPKKRWSLFQSARGGNWLMGAGIANCAAQVSYKLEDMNLLDLEERSVNVWGSSILAVCSHYHHMVGPAMIAAAKIAERRENPERVKQLCNAVIEDFQTILEQCEDDGRCPDKDEEDYTSLQSLEFAVQKFIDLGEADEKTVQLKVRLENVWKLPL